MRIVSILENQKIETAVSKVVTQDLKKQNVTLVIIAHKKRIIDLCDHTYHINQDDL